MKKTLMMRMAMALLLAPGGMLPAGCSEDPRAEISGSTAVYHGETFDTAFSCGDDASGGYLLFGGAGVPVRGDLIMPHLITLSVLPVEDAREIAARHPDFHKCASPGAAEAQGLVTQLDIVPGSDGVLDLLKEAVSLFQERVREGGDRTAVVIRGNEVTFVSAVHRESGEEVTVETLPPQMQSHLERTTYVLVTEAEIVDAEAALKE